MNAWSRFILGIHLRHPDAMPELRVAAKSIREKTGPAAQIEYAKIREPTDPESFDEYLATRDPLLEVKMRVNVVLKSFDSETKAYVEENGSHTALSGFGGDRNARCPSGVRARVSRARVCLFDFSPIFLSSVFWGMVLFSKFECGCTTRSHTTRRVGPPVQTLPRSSWAGFLLDYPCEPRLTRNLFPVLPSKPLGTLEHQLTRLFCFCERQVSAWHP